MKPTDDLYREAMAGIGTKIALQAIRKTIRDSEIPEDEKLRLIATIIHSFEQDKKED